MTLPQELTAKLAFLRSCQSWAEARQHFDRRCAEWCQWASARIALLEKMLQEVAV